MRGVERLSQLRGAGAGNPSRAPRLDPEFSKLAWLLTEKEGLRYREETLAARFQEVAAEFGIDAETLADCVYCWIDGRVPGFTGPHVVRANGEPVVRNHGGFLREYLPDIVRWCLAAKAAAKLGEGEYLFKRLYDQQHSG